MKIFAQASECSASKMVQRPDTGVGFVEQTLQPLWIALQRCLDRNRRHGLDSEHAGVRLERAGDVRQDSAALGSNGASSQQRGSANAHGVWERGSKEMLGPHRQRSGNSRHAWCAGLGRDARSWYCSRCKNLLFPTQTDLLCIFSSFFHF